MRYKFGISKNTTPGIYREMVNASYIIIGGYIAIMPSEALLLKYETCNASDTYVGSNDWLIVIHLTQQMNYSNIKNASNSKIRCNIGIILI